MKVFLGGTCAGYKWRDDLIPMLECDYYDPIVKNWSESDRLREVRERETADYVLYVITSDMSGVYSIAEIIDDSNKRPEKTIICVLYNGFGSSMERSLQAVVNLARDNGVTICETLEEVAEVLNSKNIRKFITLVDRTNRLWDTPYVYGKINDVFRLMCKIEGGINQGKVADSYEEAGRQYFRFETSKGDYEKAKNIIDTWYPNLCEFDYKLTLKNWEEYDAT
jgi:hypothetical protein